MNIKHCAALLLTAWALAGCGGGHSDDDVVADREVPASAMASSGAFIAFVSTLIKAREPEEGLSLGSMDAPVSDVAEPLELN